MKQFFKFTFASILGTLITGIILMFLFFIIIGGIISAAAMMGDSNKTASVKDNSILHITLDDPIVDRAPKNPFADIDFGPFQPEDRIGLNDILASIKKAKEDDRIKGIYLDLGRVQAGLTAMNDIRSALEDFKESDKFILSYSEGYSQGAYLIGSVADEVYLNKEGSVDIKGLATVLMFFKGTLDKLGIETQIVRGPNNRYKSAVEPFMYGKMSDANRGQVDTLLNSIWGNMTQEIAESRGITVESINEIADGLKIRLPEDAVEHKLVDGLMYKDEILADLRSKLELEEDDDLNFMSLNKYRNAKLPKDEGEEKKSWKVEDEIAVIYAIGGIQGGEGDDETIGSERISKAIREARKDEDVKAIVLRVNSPGGSALASEVIWREMVLAKEAKPVVVSMGDLAASGGYYIACASDKIYADPATITGSIGVFGLLMNTSEFFEDKMGVTFDHVSTNAHSDWGTGVRSLDDEELEAINESVIDIYDTFLQHVADGRGMTVEEVDAIAKGRIWTGKDAKEIGLVDELGGLQDAIDYAAEQAEVEDYKVKNLPKLKDPFEELMIEFTDQSAEAVLKNTLGDDYRIYQQVKTIREMKGVQARLPYAIIVK